MAYICMPSFLLNKTCKNIIFIYVYKSFLLFEMGCNCKNKVNAIDKKYGDGNNTKQETILKKIINFILQLGFGILCGIIIIVMIVPMLIYVIFCIMFGKQASFKIKDFNKILEFGTDK